MASTTNQQQPFPAVPPSQSAGDYEMRDYYAPQDVSRPPVDQTPYHTPYLGFRARMSQTPINRWTVLLFLILLSIILTIQSVNDSLASARREALSACTQVENIGSSLASMPHFMARGVNEMTASGVEKGVHGLMSVLDMSVTGVEEMVIFFIHVLTSTYLCLITLAVRGSVGAAVELGTKMADSLNKTIDEVTNGIGDATKGVTNAIDSLFDHIQGLPFVPGFERPQINLDDEINKLKSLEAPPEIQEGLKKLNDSIPTFDEVQNFTDNIIRIPFEKVKELIRSKDDWEFDRQILPVPQKEKLNFCSEGNFITNFFDGLAETVSKVKTASIAVIVVAAVLAIGLAAYLELRRWKKTREHAKLFGLGHDPMDVIYISSRPHSSGYGLLLAKIFGSPRRQIIVRWAWSYATSLAMLFVLSLALAGFASCLGQYILLKQIKAEAPELTDQVADFAGKVVTSLNNASMSWSGGVNGAMGELNSEINDEIVGWVNETTTTVNNTLNAFVDQMSKALDTAFGGTPLKDPIEDVLNCLIGLKIAGIQKALTWVKDHAHVSFPSVKNDTFSLGALAKLSDSSSAAELLADPNGKTKDEVTEIVTHVIEKLHDSIVEKALTSLALFLVWLAFTLGGIAYACFFLFRRDDSENYDPYLINPVLRSNDDTAHNVEKGQGYHESAAPPYEYPVNKAAPYTLQPRPFPTFGPTDAEPQVGQVDSRTINESARPGHLRASSYGHLDDPSPSDEKHNPFLNHPIDEKRNPFAD